MVEQHDVLPGRLEASAETRTRFVLTGAALDTLKLAAMTLMAIDHVNVVFFDGAHLWMHALGRGAFPLFAYAMAINLMQSVPLTKYVERLVIFALISQPVYMIGLGGDDLNILFTLLLAAVAGVWAFDGPLWRRHVLFWFGASSFIFNYGVDFDLSGVALPAVLACAMAGDRVCRPATFVLLLLLNFSIGDVAALRDDHLVFFAPAHDIYVVALGAVLLPLLVFGASRPVGGGRFLPRYALYIFYPAHLAVFAVYNLMSGMPIHGYFGF